jgi:hypothetical protein
LQIVVGAGILVACASTPFPHPNQGHVAAAQKQRAGITLQDLEQGRKLYLSRCGGCHQLIEPNSVAASKWPDEVAEMQERAKLETQQVDRIVAYLVTVSARN